MLRVMSAFTPVTHVIFDLDGLLVDTERVYTEAFEKACAAFGVVYIIKWKADHMGMKHDPAIEVVLARSGLAGRVSIADFSVVYDAYLDSHLADAALLPGADKLIRHLVHHKIPIAICTGSGDEDYAVKVRKHAVITENIRLSVRCSSDPAIGKGKPAPDCFLVTASRFEQPPSSPDRVLVFEDSVNGALAGLAAGMQVVMVLDPENVSPEQRRATLVLDSLCDFVPELFGLPPY